MQLIAVVFNLFRMLHNLTGVNELIFVFYFILFFFNFNYYSEHAQR